MLLRYSAWVLSQFSIVFWLRYLMPLKMSEFNLKHKSWRKKKIEEKTTEHFCWALVLCYRLCIWCCDNIQDGLRCVCVCFCLHVISSVNNMWCSALTWFTFIMQAKKEKKMYASHMWANCDPRTRSVSHVKIYSTRVNWFKYRNSYSFSVLALFFPQIKWFVLWKVKMPFKNVRDVFKKSLRSISNWWNHFGISPEIGDLLNCSAFIVFRRPSKIPIGLEAFRFPIKFL